ncbi:MAG: hypothetical protein ABW321_33620 [Polyangiales bacterium]
MANIIANPKLLSGLCVAGLLASATGCRDFRDDVACALPSNVGDPVFTPCSRTVVLETAGDGFRPPPPEGSDCRGEETFSFDLESGAFDWVTCSFSPDQPWLRSTGARTLSEEESAQLAAVLEEVTLAPVGEGCGADKPTLSLEISTSDATQKYIDSFQSCNDPAASYVDGIDPVFKLARELAAE